MLQDMVKMDHCGKPSNETDQALYGRMSKALNATGRPILFSLCQCVREPHGIPFVGNLSSHTSVIAAARWGESSVWEWGGKIAQMFRIQMDHLPFWSLPKAIGARDACSYSYFSSGPSIIYRIQLAASIRLSCFPVSPC